MSDLSATKTIMPSPENALPGRSEPIVASTHYLSNIPLAGAYPEGFEMIFFGMGCFWGAERTFWSLDGVYVTAVGYSAGYTPNPTYDEVCSGLTGHNEVVLVVYDPSKIELEQFLEVFWTSHDPTQGMCQGNDRGSQYRSGIYYSTQAQREKTDASRDRYQSRLVESSYGSITTEILEAGIFYFAESYHQQYLAKNPNGYCGLGGTGVGY